MGVYENFKKYFEVFREISNIYLRYHIFKIYIELGTSEWQSVFFLNFTIHNIDKISSSESFTR